MTGAGQHINLQINHHMLGISESNTRGTHHHIVVHTLGTVRCSVL